jgi:hypothetical protein
MYGIEAKIVSKSAQHGKWNVDLCLQYLDISTNETELMKWDVRVLHWSTPRFTQAY